MRTTAKTMIETLARADCKGRCFFIVERTAGFEFTTRFLKLRPAPHNLDDICSCDQIINEVLRDLSGHKVSNAARSAPGLQGLLLFFM